MGLVWFLRRLLLEMVRSKCKIELMNRNGIPFGLTLKSQDSEELCFIFLNKSLPLSSSVPHKCVFP